jgi:hypothetical protein
VTLTTDNDLRLSVLCTPKSTVGISVSTSHIEYYSEVEDTDIPTVDLGVPNTERGKSLQNSVAL